MCLILQRFITHNGFCIFFEEVVRGTHFYQKCVTFKSFEVLFDIAILYTLLKSVVLLIVFKTVKIFFELLSPKVKSS